MQTERQTLANAAILMHFNVCGLDLVLLKLGREVSPCRPVITKLCSSVFVAQRKVLFDSLGLTLHLHRCHFVSHCIIMAIMEMLQAVKQDSRVMKDETRAKISG